MSNTKWRLTNVLRINARVLAAVVDPARLTHGLLKHHKRGVNRVYPSDTVSRSVRPLQGAYTRIIVLVTLSVFYVTDHHYDRKTESEIEIHSIATGTKAESRDI